nr:hypothetical protein [candidate division Zixibacteria bacterium]NIR65188.1 hypothetical protein [candidate division Zixibacteria bacterium]NIU15064.1 hypothetical protein [candidate division Zixibacteria bacterium]NIW96824.1 hypothetical protein [Phycisphaerae bacterium]
RRGGVTRGYVESGGYRRYSTNVESGHIGTDAITEVQIGVFFQTTGYDTDDELWISEVEWEEL